MRFRGSGCDETTIAIEVPLGRWRCCTPGTSHKMEGNAQQTPSTQLPLAQAKPLPQLLPFVLELAGAVDTGISSD